MNRIHDFDRTFFDIIDTEEKAYALGFIYADGCHTKTSTTDCLCASQMEKDADILFKIKKAMKSTYPIREEIKPGCKSRIYHFYLYSKNFGKVLDEKGIVSNKLLVLEFPNFIPDSLMHHFIRGYFDGDGSIWDGNRKKMEVKNERKPGTTRIKIVHNVKFTFTGSNTFIPYLQDYLIENAGLSRTKLNYAKAKESHAHCTMEYSGRKNILKLYQYMYKNATIYGERKKAKFEKILCALNEKSLSEMGLIAGTPEMVISSEAEKSERSTTIPEMEVERSLSKCPTLSE